MDTDFYVKECNRLRAELALRADYAEQVRTQALEIRQLRAEWDALVDYSEAAKADLRAELAEANESLKILHGRIFSRRVYDAMIDRIDQGQARAEKAEAELAEARALVEKREAQIEWAIRIAMPTVGITTSHEPTLTWYDSMPPLLTNKHTVRFDGSRAGLLAAVDQATEGGSKCS